MLRAYRPDGSMNYEQNTLVSGDEDLEGELLRLLRDPDVSHVHVRTVLPQCFLYSVSLETVSLDAMPSGETGPPASW